MSSSTEFFTALRKDGLGLTRAQQAALEAEFVKQAGDLRGAFDAAMKWAGVGGLLRVKVMTRLAALAEAKDR